MIRPPDPAIRWVTMRYMPIHSSEAFRRLVDLAFRDARTAPERRDLSDLPQGRPSAPGFRQALRASTDACPSARCVVSGTERALWTAIRRALMMIVSAIDAYLKESAPSGKR